jgi:hypothetical protein
MATTEARGATPAADAAFRGAKDLNEQFLAAARKAGNLYLHSYEKAVEGAIEFELALARHTEHEWLKDVIEAQAEMTREITHSYTSAARSLLK